MWKLFFIILKYQILKFLKKLNLYHGKEIIFEQDISEKSLTEMSICDVCDVQSCFIKKVGFIVYCSRGIKSTKTEAKNLGLSKLSYYDRVAHFFDPSK